MDKYAQIKKEQDRSLMVSYYVTNVMFESLPRENSEEFLCAIRKSFEPIMHLFNEPLSDDDYEFLADMPLSLLMRYCK